MSNIPTSTLSKQQQKISNLFDALALPDAIVLFQVVKTNLTIRVQDHATNLEEQANSFRLTAESIAAKQ